MTTPPHRAFALAYRISSLMWMTYAAALALTALGSQLLAWAQPFRMTVLVLAVISGLAMIVRAVAPARPEWTRWTLPVMATISVSTFTLTLFASEMAGGLNVSRTGYALLLLTPALTAYLHWIGEKVVSRS